ncbi:MAG: hypothetical protein WC402_01495 [Candidatus Pacearchaeota archaeon]|jgi:hypothetical protein
MKNRYLIPIVVIIGIIILFLFPEPETNFLAYAGTALFFILIVLFLLVRYKREK